MASYRKTALILSVAITAQTFNIFELVEGYQARNQENSDLTKEFETVDLEGWDEDYTRGFLAGLDPVVGKEISKTRPGRYLQFEFFLAGETSGLTKGSKIKTDQIRTLDKRRLLKFIGGR